MVYTPEFPGLHYLDPHAWLVFELCSEVPTYQRLFDEFIAAAPPDTTKDQGTIALDAALHALVAAHLVCTVSASGSSAGYAISNEQTEEVK
jgi:hypothetical protein